MGTPRGREARLRKQFAPLYGGIDPGVWTPVETLLRQVTDMVHSDRTKSGVITGERLLRDELAHRLGSKTRTVRYSPEEGGETPGVIRQTPLGPPPG